MTTALGGQMPPVDPDPLWRHPWVVSLSQVARRLRRADRARPWVLDTLVVVGAVLLFCVPDQFRGGDPREVAGVFTELPRWGMIALQAGLMLPLFVRRRAPMTAFVLTAAAFVVQWSLLVFLRADVAVLIALYSLTLHSSLRRLLWASAITIAAFTFAVIRIAGIVSVAEIAFFLVMAMTAAIALGLVVRIRRSQLAALRDRAARLEIERDQRTLLAVAGERARVAREMHDILGHNLSVIIRLADGGAYAVRVHPERTAQALTLIGETGREALNDLRRTLGALRDETAVPELSPQPGIADVDALCERFRAAGPRVSYRTAGEFPADRGLQLAAYRIVQEALTNTLKHAGPDTDARVSLEVVQQRLRIQVEDTGPVDVPLTPETTAESAPGQGLIGMRERAALYGGVVRTGRTPAGGWRVQTELDLAPQRTP
ncbi:signal transduction histidine kinase [Kribbella aluminosa]|uniref:histidine kinase n=1 Tax=Kribbella aluminosa TaxID=416017 RepID=A0ABS4UW35_9ACTN|nr:histidine kinase [Kribbella aluminosa]MBP2355852.1 signal transduction histidine kinase [Kribbella aluminosa]